MKKFTVSILSFITFLANAQLPATWIEVPVPTTKDLKSIVFPTPMVGYIGGEDSLLLKTVDGGITWNHIPYTGINFLGSSFIASDDFLELDFVTDNIGYAAVGLSTYRTTDGGLTWSVLNAPPSINFHNSLYFTADGEGFIGGFQEYVIDALGYQKEQIVRSDSGVLNPTNLLASSALTLDTITDIDFDLNDSLGIAVSTGGRIFRTIDGGSTWDTIQSPYGNLVPLTSVTITNSNWIFAGYDGNASMLAGFELSGLLLSLDGGLNWFSDLNTAFFTFSKHNTLHTTTSGNIYCGASSTLFSLNDAGSIIEMLNGVGNVYLVDVPINSMTSYSDTIVWGAGNNGYLVKRGPAETLSLNNQDFLKKVIIYPNPANNEIKIVLPEAFNNPFSLELSSMDGKIIKTGMNDERVISLEDIEPGTYLLKFLNKEYCWSKQFVKQ